MFLRLNFNFRCKYWIRGSRIKVLGLKVVHLKSYFKFFFLLLQHGLTLFDLLVHGYGDAFLIKPALITHCKFLDHSLSTLQWLLQLCPDLLAVCTRVLFCISLCFRWWYNIIWLFLVYWLEQLNMLDITRIYHDRISKFFLISPSIYNRLQYQQLDKIIIAVNPSNDNVLYLRAFCAITSCVSNL